MICTMQIMALPVCLSADMLHPFVNFGSVQSRASMQLRPAIPWQPNFMRPKVSLCLSRWFFTTHTGMVWTTYFWTTLHTITLAVSGAPQ
jgi:hypothetical protein